MEEADRGQWRKKLLESFTERSTNTHRSTSAVVTVSSVDFHECPSAAVGLQGVPFRSTNTETDSASLECFVTAESSDIEANDVEQPAEVHMAFEIVFPWSFVAMSVGFYCTNFNRSRLPRASGRDLCCVKILKARFRFALPAW